MFWLAPESSNMGLSLVINVDEYLTRLVTFTDDITLFASSSLMSLSLLPLYRVICKSNQTR